MRAPYPVTIIADRYGGSYSGAKWTAWNLDAELVPSGASYSDCECATFWQYNSIPVGLGDTPQEAYNSLCLRLAPDQEGMEMVKHGDGMLCKRCKCPLYVDAMPIGTLYEVHTGLEHTKKKCTKREANLADTLMDQTNKA